jgi:simple sugar transport system permease protein
VRPAAFRRAIARPEAAAAAGAFLVWIVFALAAGPAFRGAEGAAAYLNAAAPLGILAVGVTLLMIGGEFDLSVGSVVGASGIVLMLLVTEGGWSLWPAAGVALGAGIGVGLLNGYVVVRTGLPSFIVTLATLFIVRGLTISLTRALTGRTQLGGLEQVAGYESARTLLASTPVEPFDVAILWWLGLAALASWVLLRTQWGNWIFAAGGNPEAARSVGVPVASVKIALFVTTAACASFVGILQAVRFTGADVLRGQLQEFHAIVATVIGGTLLTGGYGSVVGAVFGSAVFGMVRQGIVMSGVDADWFQVFLGAMLLLAVLVNAWALRLVTKVR